MAKCERVLRNHVDCVKGWLREARSKDLVYAPGSYTEHDRCQLTRQAYQDCRKGGDQPSSQSEDHSHTNPHGGSTVKHATREAHPYELPARLGVGGPVSSDYDQPGSSPHLMPSKAPLPCEQELNQHGQCVEKTFREAMSKGGEYIWLTYDGDDKCFKTRSKFDQCMASYDEYKTGKKKDDERVKAWESPKVANNFSVQGHW